MVEILCVKLGNDNKFTISKGLSEIVPADARIVAVKNVFIRDDCAAELEAAGGPGSVRKEILRLFNMAEEVEYRVVDEDGAEMETVAGRGVFIKS